MPATTYSSDRVTVTVMPNRRLTLNVGGFLYVYLGGMTTQVGAWEVAYLRSSGVIV